jgi:hypothetical protein
LSRGKPRGIKPDFRLKNIRKSRTGDAALYSFPLNKFKNFSGMIKKSSAMKHYVQNDVGIDQNLHFRYLLNRSARISSGLMPPIWESRPQSRSVSGVGRHVSSFPAVPLSRDAFFSSPAGTQSLRRGILP